MSGRIQTCCVFKCINTPLNSKVKFFSLPDPRLRPDQRYKWVEAIQNKNGQWWMPNATSTICSEHFEKGHPSKVPQDPDYVPTVFITRRKVESIKSRAVSLKRFALEYMKHEALLERPSRSNLNTKRRKFAYAQLAAALDVPVTTARIWERRFRQYFEEKLADPDHKWEPAADGAPHWKTAVEKRLFANPVNRLSAIGFGGALSARGVVAALCAAARARGSLCSTALYQDVRRALRLTSAINDLHAVWVSAQRVSLEQVQVAGRAGDAGLPVPPSAAQVADLVLLHTDVDMHRLVTDESVSLYEESSALHTLWQLVQQHQLEEAAPVHTRERAHRWSSAHRDYLASGRTASLVVLQRRWHELKLQARARLAAHWRRAPAPPLFEDLAPAPDSAPDPAPPPPPHEVYPRPAPLHISILKRYPHIATGPFKCWREQVLDGSIVTEPLDEENDIKIKQNQDSELSTATPAPGDDAAGAHLYPNLSKVDEPKENTDSDTLCREPAVKQPKIEQDDLAEQSTADDHLAEHPTHSELLAELVNKFKDELHADSDLLAVQPTESELFTVGESKVKQNQDNDLLVEGSTVDAPLAESAAGRASIASCPNTPSRAGDQIYRHVNKSDVILPMERANGSDTDTEDNLVIDECSNMTPCSLKREPAAHTETHSGDTVSPHVLLENSAPTIEVLHKIDPSTVKTEILFESDEDDFKPCSELDKDEMELETMKEASFISNRIVFVDEEPGGSCDVTNRRDCQNGQNMDDDTPTFDHKLLMETSVPLFRIDKTRAWRNNVRRDNSIRVSRIHRRYYTPIRKNKICNKNQSKTLEITVDKSCLDKIANTDRIRQLCRNIKLDMIEEQPEVPEVETPDKKVKAESDSEDDQPLLEIRKEKSGESADDAEDPDWRELVEESTSDDERVNEKMLSTLKRRGKRLRALGARGRGCSRAASSIEWVVAESPASARVAKRVSLPDREQLRRLNSARQVAQVAPITSATSACGEDVAMEQPQGDAADDDTPLAWRALDLPAQHELQTALDELTLASTAEQALEGRGWGRGGAHCCAARRQREVNDTRRRLGLPDAKQHTHADGECTCCCAHLSDEAARARLDAQLRALHDDIERMLWKAAEGRPHSKPKRSRSPSPAHASSLATAASSGTAATAHKQAPTDPPSKAAIEARSSKTKPATYSNRSKRARTRGRAPPAPAPATPPVDDYEEWQRQKNVNAQYFHINGNSSSKKDKSAARVSVIQSTATQSTARKSVTTQSTARKSATTQSTARKSTTTQATAMQSASQDSAAPVSNPPSVIVGAQSGLMPYIRDSRLLAAVSAPPAPPAAPAPLAPPAAPWSRRQPDKPIRIAPKPDNMPRPAELAQHNTAKQKPATTKKCSEDRALPHIQLPPLTPRRMSPSTELVAAPASSEPNKPVSLLEQYARSLPASSAPLVNALSLRVPASQQRTSTTIVMALTLPSESVINDTINGLYANDTVDLTEETDSSNSLIKQSAQKTSSPVVDIVGMVKSLMNPVNKGVAGRSLLKCLSNSASGRSLLRTNINSPSDNTPDTLTATALCKGLHDGDVIEIDDSDSNPCDGADGNQSNSNNSYILVNNSSNPAVYTNKSSNQAKLSNTEKSSDQTTNKADESLNQAATTKSDEAVSNTKPASEANGPVAAEDKPEATSSVPVKKIKKKRVRVRDKSRYLKPSNLLKSSEDEVRSHAAARACSRIPELAALADGRGRCPARRAQPAAMPAFLQQLRRVARPDDEVYCYKLAAAEQAVSALPCGGTLLCVDAALAPLVLPARAAHARAHLVLSDAELPCALPTYWTLWAFAQVTRVVPDEALAPPASGASDASEPRGPAVTPEQDTRQFCEKQHNFKILTAFCSADGVRQAARAGATLFLLNVLRGRICVLGVARERERGSVRHRVRADVDPGLMQELEAMLDDAEVDEELGGRADETDQ